MAKSRAKVHINIRLGESVFLRKIVSGVNLAREEAENQLIDMLTIPPRRSGRHYAGNPNTSSAPGESPAPQTGGLLQGVGSTPPQVISKTRVAAVVASRSRHSADLELGTDKIEPRPHVSRLRDEKPRLSRIERAFKIGAQRV